MRTRDKQRLERAVARGVAYLDANPDKEEAFEEWYRRVNVNYLQMSSGSYCIIGQTLGDYNNLATVDDFGRLTEEQLNAWASRHGFLVRDRNRIINRTNQWLQREIDYEWRDDAYAYLTLLWSTAVTVHLLADSLTESLTGLSDGLPVTADIDPYE